MWRGRQGCQQYLANGGYLPYRSFILKPVQVETTLDAKMWFELKGDAFPEFIYADLCITPPWESSTYQSTTTDAGN